jgi:hypothetical protein
MEFAMEVLLQKASDMGFDRGPVEAMARRIVQEARGRRRLERVCGELGFALSLHIRSSRTWDQVHIEVNDYMRRWLDDEGLDDN